MSDRAEMEAALEAVLFVADEPLSRNRLLEIFPEGERAEAAEALDAVAERYRPEEGRGVAIERVAGGLRLVTRPELAAYLKRFFEASGRGRLSMAALETLAIVAYRQPVTGPEIQELRGVTSSSVLKTLLERRMIRITGRKPVVGKPFIYATTREFLMHFGLPSLTDLPPLEEFEEAFGEAEGSGGSGGLLDGLPGTDRDAGELSEDDELGAGEASGEAASEIAAERAGPEEEGEDEVRPTNEDRAGSAARSERAEAS